MDRNNITIGKKRLAARRDVEQGFQGAPTRLVQNDVLAIRNERDLAHADEIDAMGYQRWRADRMYLLVPAQAVVADFLATFQEFPPRQKPASFTIDQVMEKMIPRTN